jgi:hypothetical protein
VKLDMLQLLAAITDIVHAGVMLVWGLGMPFLFWHRFARLSRAYMWFSLVFVVVTVASRVLIGECFLTTIARELWLAGDGFREQMPFTVLLTEWVAGIRPTAREAVLLWEFAVFVSSAGGLWCWYRTTELPRASAPPSKGRAEQSTKAGGGRFPLSR